ncbi:MAG: DNA mismatch repair protein MutS [Alphaproteobacteria bacterium]|nr:DNA mismatch repair protein MutS [Alphaproteobacteria bacterium]
MIRRHTRQASEEEETLFRTALKDAKPLKKRRVRTSVAPKPVKVVRPPSRIPAPEFNEVPAPKIGGHDDARLRRGRGEPEARLDLHGMTQDAAYRASVRFLMGARAEGQRLVLVITGKGGILRGQLPLWLGQGDLKPLVGGVAEAHARHGGAGAYYVTLRRKR